MLPVYTLLLSAVCWAETPQGVVLDFSAQWCGPCQQMSPLVARLEREGYPIRKVDVDKEPALARQFKVSSIPAFVLIVNGQEVQRIVGQTSETQLKQLLAQIPRQTSGAIAQIPAEKHAAPVAAAHVQPSQVQIPSATVPGAPVVAAVPAQPKFKLPFLGRPKPPKPIASTGAEVVRAKIDDAQPLSKEEAPTGPLASSARIRVKDTKGENFGSGTIIDSQIGRTLVLTCAHIFRNLDKSSTIEVDLFHRGKSETFVGKVLQYQLDSDVGLIAINTDVPLPVSHVAPLGFKVIKGLPVISIGCGGGEDPTIQELRVTALNRYLGPDNLECSGVPVQGRSGGGLLTRDGLVIGVCTAADPRDQRGLYAGLQTIHDLLDRCKLAHLYRPSGEAKAPTLVATTAPVGLDAASEDQDQPIENLVFEMQRAGATERNLEEDVTEEETAALAAATEIDDQDSEVLQKTLQGTGPAEVVCVIRPINKPRGASRVVVINRASSKFISYLTNELETQAEIQPTSLSSSKGAPRSVRKPVAPTSMERDRSFDHESADDAAPRSTTGPRPYRRNSSRTASRE